MNKGYLYALIAVFFFTFTPIFVRVLLPYIDAEPMNFFRFFFAAIVLVIATGFTKTPLLRSMTKRRFISYAFLGILFALVLYTYVIAISHTYVANAQFLQQLSPIYTFIFAYVFLKEVVGKRLYYSLALAMLGAFIILYFSTTDSLFETQAIGNVVALISGVILAGYTTFSRHIGKNYPVIQSTAWAFIFGMVFMSFSLFNVPNLSYMNWLLLIMFGIFSTAMPFRYSRVLVSLVPSTSLPHLWVAQAAGQ